MRARLPHRGWAPRGKSLQSLLGIDTYQYVPQHIEYAAVHRDDSDDDSDDESIDDSSEGWEDELGATEFPEENVRVVEDSEDEEDADYWTEDDAEDFEEEREAYFGSSHHRAAVAAAASETTQANSPHVHPASAVQDTCRTGNASPSSVAISCPLCLEAPTETSATRCGHLFCTP